MTTLDYQGAKIAALSLASSYAKHLSFGDIDELLAAHDQDQYGLMATVATMAGLSPSALHYLKGTTSEPLDILRPFARQMLEIGRDVHWFVALVDPSYWRSDNMTQPYHEFHLMEWLQAMSAAGWRIAVGESGLEVSFAHITLAPSDFAGLITAYQLTRAVPKFSYGEQE